MGHLGSYRRLVVHRRVVVNMKSGRAVEGVVTTIDGPLLEVKDATVLEPNAPSSRVDGAIVVHREDIDFIQTMGG